MVDLFRVVCVVRIRGDLDGNHIKIRNILHKLISRADIFNFKLANGNISMSRGNHINAVEMKERKEERRLCIGENNYKIQPLYTQIVVVLLLCMNLAFDTLFHLRLVVELFVRYNSILFQNFIRYIIIPFPRISLRITKKSETEPNMVILSFITLSSSLAIIF